MIATPTGDDTIHCNMNLKGTIAGEKSYEWIIYDGHDVVITENGEQSLFTNSNSITIKKTGPNPSGTITCKLHYYAAPSEIEAPEAYICNTHCLFPGCPVFVGAGADLCFPSLTVSYNKKEYPEPGTTPKQFLLQLIITDNNSASCNKHIEWQISGLTPIGTPGFTYTSNWIPLELPDETTTAPTVRTFDGVLSKWCVADPPSASDCKKHFVITVKYESCACVEVTLNSVNLFTGEKIESETDLSIGGNGFNWSFSRNYGSQDTNRSMIGYGWATNWDKRLFMKDSDHDRLVDVLDTFPDNATSWVSTTPPDPVYYDDNNNPIADLDGDLVADTPDLDPANPRIPLLDYNPIGQSQWIPDTGAFNFSFYAVDRNRLPQGIVPKYTIYAYDGKGTGKPYYSTCVNSTVFDSNAAYISPSNNYDRLTIQNWGNAQCTITVNKPDGSKETYYGFHPNRPDLKDGRLSSIEDKDGNRITLTYDSLGRVSIIEDNHNRYISFHYWDQVGNLIAKANLLEHIEDSEGRSVVYDYDEDGNLVSVNNLSDVNNERETRYDYLKIIDYPEKPDLWHNLIKVYRPREVAASKADPNVPLKPYKVIAYGTEGGNRDRVTSEFVGDKDAGGNVICGGTETFEYFDNLNTLTRAAGAAAMTRHTDAAGVAIEYYFNDYGVAIKKVKKSTTGDLVTTSQINGEGQTIQTQDEAGKQGGTRYLAITESAYRGLGRRLMGLPAVTSMTCSCGGGTPTILQQTYSYEPLTCGVRVHTDERGNQTVRIYDYQEDTNITSVLTDLANKMGLNGGDPDNQQAVQDLLTYLGVPLGLGDQNGDNITTQHNGNVVKEILPTVTLISGSNQAGINSTSQQRTRLLGYNNNSEKIFEIDPEGNRTEYDYYTTGTLAGLLYMKKVDTASGTGRNNGTDPDPVNATWFYTYDNRGNLLTETDPRGVRTDREYNQFNELTMVTRAAAVDNFYGQSPAEPNTLEAFGFQTKYIYNANGQLAEEWVQDPAQKTAAGEWIKTLYDYDILGRKVSETKVANASDPSKNQVTYYYYNSAGQQSLVVYPEGNADYTEYDQLGRVHKTIRGIQSLTGLPAGAIVNPPSDEGFSTRGGVPYQTRYVYDAQKGYLTDIVAGETQTTHFAYDENGRKSSQTDPTGAQTFWKYDQYGQLIDEQRVARVSDQGGETTVSQTQYVYDNIGRKIQVNQKLYKPVGVTTQRTISLSPGSLGGKPSSGSWIGRRTEYDRLGRVTFIVDDEGHSTQQDYDGMGRIIKTTDAQMNTLENWYDDAGNVIETRRTDKSTLTGTLDEIFHTTFFYDSLGRLVTQVDNQGRAIDTRYNSRDQVVAVSEGNSTSGRGTIYRRDVTTGQGQPVSCGTFGHVTTYEYDALGQRVQEDKLMGSDTSSMARTTIGANLVYTLDYPLQAGGDGKITSRYEYDKNGNLVALTDDNGNQTRWEYDSQNRRVSETKGYHISPNLADDLSAAPSSVIWVSYDVCNNLEQMVKEDGTTVNYHYTASGLLDYTNVTDRATGVLGTTRQDFKYDGLGRRIWAADDNGSQDGSEKVTVTWAYDSLGRLMEESSQIGTSGPVRYTSNNYDSERRSALIYPNGRQVDLGYNSLGGLNLVKDHAPSYSIATYHYIGSRLLRRQMVGGTTANGVDLDFRNGSGTYYDAMGRPTRYQHVKNGTVVLGEEQVFSPDGNVTYQANLRDTLADSQYAYDPAGRLTQAWPWRTRSQSELGMPLSSSWSLDGAGNWSANGNTMQQSGLTENYSFQDNVFNQYTTINSVNPTYDPNGNLTANPLRGQQYSWDAFNRLVRVADSAGTIVSYLYDATGRRLRKDEASRDSASAWSSYHIAGRVSANTESSGVEWNNLDAAFIGDSVGATATYPAYTSAGSKELRLGGYLFNIPAGATITRIGVRVGRWSDQGTVLDGGVALAWSGGVSSTRSPYNLSGGNYASSAEIADYGDDGDTWGRTWTAAEINSPSFGVVLHTAADGTASEEDTAHVDYAIVSVWYTAPAKAERVTDSAMDGWQILEEHLNGYGNSTRQWVYGSYIDEPLVMDVNGDADSTCIGSGDSRYFYHQNLNWSVIGLTNAAGQVVEAYEYGPYGRHVTLSDGNGNGTVDFDGSDNLTLNGASPLGNPYLYTGQRFDLETGMSYYKLRYYDTQIGRFVSRDPKNNNKKNVLGSLTDLREGQNNTPNENSNGFTDNEYLSSGFSCDGACPVNDFDSSEYINYYQYSSLNPINATDPYGLKIFLVAGNNSWNPINSALHQKVCVSKWRRKVAYDKQGRLKDIFDFDGYTCFSFGYSRPGFTLPKSHWLGWKSNVFVGCLRGSIYEDDYIQGVVLGVKNTTSMQDMKWLSYMRSERHGIEDVYSLARHNCVMYSSLEFASAPGGVNNTLNSSSNVNLKNKVQIDEKRMCNIIWACCYKYRCMVVSSIYLIQLAF